jgi:hypothetical protein
MSDFWLRPLAEREREIAVYRAYIEGWLAGSPDMTRTPREWATRWVGINPSWGITVRLRWQPPPPNGGLRLVA